MFGKHEPTVDIGGRQYTMAQLKEAYLEVVKDYNQLHDRYAALQRHQEQMTKQADPQSAEQLPFAEPGELTAADVEPVVDTALYTQPELSGQLSDEDLIGRYYMLVLASMREYKAEIQRLQKRLDNLLADSRRSGMLKLVAIDLPAGDYQQQFTKRNDQLVNYVDTHPQQVRLVNDGKTFDRDDDQRGIKYWEQFVAYYRQQLESLLKKNQQMRDNFKFALRQGKKAALTVRDQKPSFLSGNAALRLGDIDSGIKDRRQWEQQMTDFHHRLTNFRQGTAGERRIRNVVDETHNLILTSLNLPYSYDGQHPNSNQVDCIVVNRQGIFVLEVKNFTASELGINADGTVYGKWGPKFRRYEKMNIIKQGERHWTAVKLALAKDPLTAQHLRYLTKNLHVLYVSANPATNRRPAPAGKPAYRFIGLDDLVKTLNSAGGNLRPEIVEQVGEALTKVQQEEKAYRQYLFPDDPDVVLAGAWQQLQVIEQLNQASLDDLVNKKDPELIRALQQAGLKACDGFVTHQPRHQQ